MQRDFTFIDDIVKGVLKIIPSPPAKKIPHTIYNMGCSTPVKLLDFLSEIEKVTGKKANITMTGMQPGDVVSTYADTSLLQHNFNYRLDTSLEKGLEIYYHWFIQYYPVT